MSAKNHFVIWKGVRSGPFTKEELEREFSEGRMGLVRTVQVGSMKIAARDFVSDLEITRREQELEEQLARQKREADAAAERARQEAERKQEEYIRQLEEERNRPKANGKTIPPPIPEVNPWAPGGGLHQHSAGKSSIPLRNSELTWWVGSGPVIAASLFCLLCLLTGQFLREVTGLLALGFAMTLLIRRRTVAGGILTAASFLSYGLGFLLSDLIHDYITKNYPN